MKVVQYVAYLPKGETNPDMPWFLMLDTDYELLSRYQECNVREMTRADVNLTFMTIADLQAAGLFPEQEEMENDIHRAVEGSGKTTQAGSNRATPATATVATPTKSLRTGG